MIMQTVNRKLPFITENCLVKLRCRFLESINGLFFSLFYYWYDLCTVIISKQLI